MGANIGWPDETAAQLVALLGTLGSGDGLVSASAYDTAQVVRFAPPREHGRRPALEWLLRQQSEDGGWGGRAEPLSRHASTLAAALALAQHGGDEGRAAVERALAFLRDAAPEWRDVELDRVAVGGELIVSRLLLDAAEAGLDVEPEPYAAAVELAELKLSVLLSMSWPAGSAALYTWETWGAQPQRSEQSRAGDIGTSPSATARWITCGADPEAAARAHGYLERAAAATGTGIPGVVPTVHGIGRAEQIWGLYPLLCLLGRTALPAAVQAALERPVADLDRCYRERGGAPYADAFDVDGDCTATAACCLLAAGRAVPVESIRRFQRGELFYTYEFERNPSVVTIAHCLHAMALLGESCEEAWRYLEGRRGEDGLWHTDKFHSSWCYVTSQVVAALAARGADDALVDVATAICEQQRPDGGFSAAGESTTIETAYMALALAAIARRTAAPVAEARHAATGYLVSRRGESVADVSLWVGKEAYGVPRADGAWRLAALLGDADADAATLAPPLRSGRT